MPETLDQPMPRLTFAAKFLAGPASIAEPDSAAIASFIKGFDGHKKFLDVLRKLDEELAELIRHELIL